MWRVALPLCMMSAALAVAGAQPKADFYVAPNGNDSWSGKLTAPDRQRTDGPFATLKRAQQAVRELRRNQRLNRPVVVMVRKGAYYLNEPLVFTPEDSGTAQSPT
ncbi:MAG: right-handed parallel beta-helix repeat-containing protein, partial [bacterium]|nr:right-handed parallel beta-helix repeat-containing protein [bacterium]